MTRGGARWMWRGSWGCWGTARGAGSSSRPTRSSARPWRQSPSPGPPPRPPPRDPPPLAPAARPPPPPRASPPSGPAACPGPSTAQPSRTPASSGSTSRVCVDVIIYFQSKMKPMNKSALLLTSFICDIYLTTFLQTFSRQQITVPYCVQILFCKVITSELCVVRTSVNILAKYRVM